MADNLIGLNNPNANANANADADADADANANANANAHANANANANGNANLNRTLVQVPHELVQATRTLNDMNITVQRLDGTNFLPWSRQIKLLLKIKKLDRALFDPEVDEEMDNRAVLILLDAMDTAHKIQVQAEVTARQIMSCLERQYANASAANKLRLLVGYLRFTKAPNDTINQHYGKLKEQRAALANLGETHSEEFFQVILINSLTDGEYGDLLSQ